MKHITWSDFIMAEVEVFLESESFDCLRAREDYLLQKQTYSLPQPGVPSVNC
jgi:hypothetical protein